MAMLWQNYVQLSQINDDSYNYVIYSDIMKENGNTLVVGFVVVT